MIAQLRQLYPKCSLVSELIDIDRGLYIVKASIQVDGVTLSTGLAATERIETAEDRARERAIAALSLEVLTSLANSSPSPTKNSTSVKSPRSQNVIQPTERKIDESIPDDSKVINLSSSSQDTKLSNSSAKAAYLEFPVTKETRETSNLHPPETPLDEEQSQEEIYETTKAKDTALDETQSENLISSEDQYPPKLSDSAASSPEVVEIDFNEIKHKTDIEIKRLGWSKEDGRNFLKSHYGKRTRLHLTDEQLLEFLHYLESLPTPLEN
ncbi:MAG: hypothetical protein Tsb0014_45620 [Pleurocapsa sp.]